MLDLHEARNSVNWCTKQLHLLHYTPTFQALLGAKLPHLIAFLSIKDVTQFNTSDWVEVMWYTQNTFKGQSSDPVHNPVQRLDLTQTERKYTLQMDFLNWQSLSIDFRLSPFTEVIVIYHKLSCFIMLLQTLLPLRYLMYSDMHVV